jgi:hypothetical protein
MESWKLEAGSWKLEAHGGHVNRRLLKTVLK